jgi:hypothetical protein
MDLAAVFSKLKELGGRVYGLTSFIVSPFIKRALTTDAA